MIGPEHEKYKAAPAPFFLYPIFSSIVTQTFFSRRLPATMVTLAWASLNMVGLSSLKDFDDGGIIYLWSGFLFTLYYGVSMIVLLNMLIAMMSNSYQQIEVSLMLLDCVFRVSNEKQARVIKQSSTYNDHSKLNTK